ncbi:hypothetical protein TWF481_003628 [Arthrobotrys musiformis]|uniref:Uncharacterized protein n=1 Tax=Arthrobotrys musiformis TaxID=47236 RepID=A0AAV9WJ40_9PEZI
MPMCESRASMQGYAKDDLNYMKNMKLDPDANELKNEPMLVDRDKEVGKSGSDSSLYTFPPRS